MRNADCLVAEETTIGSFLKFYQVGVGILDRIFKREPEETILPRLGFGTGMENIYIFRDGNGIGVSHPYLFIIDSTCQVLIMINGVF